jgi:dihydroorotase
VTDTTHIETNTMKKVPERIMKQLARKIFKAKGQQEYKIPVYTQIENHLEAKQVMKEYLEDLIEQSSEEAASEKVLEAVKQALYSINLIAWDQS